MRRIGDLMKDLGFNKDAPEATAEAFIHHLIDAGQVSQIQRKSKEIDRAPQQLSFPLEQIMTESEPASKTRKQTG